MIDSVSLRGWVITLLLLCCGALASISTANAQQKTNHESANPPNAGIPHLQKKGTATQLIVGGRPFIMLAGEIHNSSASNLEYMEPVWKKLVSLNCNSAFVPLYWELIEPEEGKSDFRLLDGLIEGARRHNLRLGFLWFATWKNSWSTYAPAWVKTDLKRFPRYQATAGRSSGIISYFSYEANRADARAFAAVMQRIREIDGQRQTVVMMQVQNEAGMRPAARDHSPVAEEQFSQPVPKELMQSLAAQKENLVAEFKEIWGGAGFRQAGTWPEVFGAAADEVFSAWHVARYINKIAEAGKAEYALPMFANAWLVQRKGQQPGAYPSGGPVAKMMNVWRAAAPAIDLLAPDIYLDDFKGITEEYTQAGNPLLIPEARRDETAAANAFYAIGQHGAIAFAPFGIDSMPDDHPIRETYKLLSSISHLVAQHHGAGSMAGILQGKDQQSQEIDIGAYRIKIEFSRSSEKGAAPGAGLVIALSPDEYLVAGMNIKPQFQPRPDSGRGVDFLSIDEGVFQDGKWVAGRRLNGDERIMQLGGKPGLLRVKLYSHP